MLLALVVFFGTAGYILIEKWSFFDALYMTVITLTTTGFTEVQPLGSYGRLFTIVLLTSGIMVATAALAAFTRFVVEGEILNIMGKKRLMKEIGKIKDHYIICGFGRIGRVIAREFYDNQVPFIIIDGSPEEIQNATKEGFIALQGNAVEDETLELAGIKRAKGLIAAVSTSADNVYIALTAKSLNPSIFVMGRAEDDTSAKRLKSAGADEVVSPYFIGGRRMAHAILRPAVMEFVDLAVGRKNLALAMEEIKVAEGSRLVGKTIIDSEVRNRYGIIIVSIIKADGKMIFNPPPSTIMEEGDTLIAIGKIQDLKALA